MRKPVLCKEILVVMLLCWLLVPAVVHAEELEVTRIEGEDYLEKNIEIIQENWEQAEVVVMASGEDYPDALAGIPWAHSLEAPIIMTPPEEIPSYVKEELAELDTEKVIILGGEKAVSEQVEEELESEVQVRRVYGEDRYETSREIAAEMGFSDDKAVVASGENFPDALAIGPYAAQKGYSVLLTRAEAIPEATQEALEEVESALAVGGEAVIGEEVKSELPSSTRIWGENRRQTALEIAGELGMDRQDIYLVPDSNFQEALLVSASASKKANPVLLAREKVVKEDGSEKLREWMVEHDLEEYVERVTVVPPADSDEDEETEQNSQEEPEPVFKQRGTASWYGSRFHGSRTASGEVFDQYDMTAAHRELPFGTEAEVEFVETGQSVTVRINDRGPHVSGRVIDLSRGAAEEIGLRAYGVGEVIIKVYE